VEPARAGDTGCATRNRTWSRRKPTTRVVLRTTDCEAGTAGRGWSPTDPPGIGFPGRDGAPPAMTPAVSVPGDNLLAESELQAYGLLRDKPK
jgi:hypothetical protein